MSKAVYIVIYIEESFMWSTACLVARETRIYTEFFFFYFSQCQFRERRASDLCEEKTTGRVFTKLPAIILKVDVPYQEKGQHDLSKFTLVRAPSQWISIARFS